MPTARNFGDNNNRVPRDRDVNARAGFDPRFDRPSTNDTAKANYTALYYGNDHGHISFGHIHQTADVTAGVLLETSDARHSFFLDNDGPRKGWTTSLSPGHFQLECGSDVEEAKDSLVLNAKNGNITIVASNGKIRLQGTDIELIAVGEGGSKGNVRIKANENIDIDANKKLILQGKASYKLTTTGIGEVTATSTLKIYGSIIQGVTDACAIKDSKNNGQRYQKKMFAGI